MKYIETCHKPIYSDVIGMQDMGRPIELMVICSKGVKDEQIKGISQKNNLHICIMQNINMTNFHIPPNSFLLLSFSPYSKRHYSNHCMIL